MRTFKTFLPVLHTPDLMLRMMTHDDVTDIFAYAGDPDVARFTHWQTHKNFNDTSTFIAATHCYAQLKQSLLWGIVLKSDQKIIGECGFTHLIDTRAELYYALGKKYWGLGYTTQALQAVLKYGFSDLYLSRVEAWIIAENYASLRVAEKLGMQRESILYNHWHTKAELHNIHIYSIEPNRKIQQHGTGLHVSAS